MSKTLVKIVDASLFPAALMVAGKFIGLYLVLNIFNLEWGVENTPNSIVSARPVLLGEDLAFASSYSDLFVILLMLLGFSYYVIKAVFFHSSHIDPRLATRLAINGLFDLVKDSFEIYNKASIWLLFVWLTNVTIIVNTLMGKTYTWVLLFSVTISLLLTIILLRDVAYEINIAQGKIKNYSS